MDAFKRTYDYQANKERWWLEIKGKGDKMRKIPVNQILLESLIDYRRLQNLPDYPQPYETEPLIKSLITNQAISSRRVNQLIKSIAQQAAQHFEKNQPEKAKKLKKFSAHWLRHLSVSMQGLAKIDKQVIKENVGHKSIQTTEVYLHTFENYQHDVDLAAKLNEWGNFYNYHRPHGSFNGQTAYETLKQKLNLSILKKENIL